MHRGEGKSRKEDAVSSSKPENSSLDLQGMSARFFIKLEEDIEENVSRMRNRVLDVTGAFFLIALSYIIYERSDYMYILA